MHQSFGEEYKNSMNRINKTTSTLYMIEKD